MNISGHYAHAPIVAEATYRRIELIVKQLGKVAQETTGWKILYMIRTTRWELPHPQGELLNSTRLKK